MKIFISKIAALTLSFAFFGCATSMAPSQFLQELTRATKSKLYSRPLGDEAIASGRCSLLVRNRKYTAPIGFTVDDDLQNGAAGVDEWVRADGGNGYILNNFEWVSIGDQGVTQLLVYFDTVTCK